MDLPTRALIEALHRESPYQYVAAVTGGGAAAAAMLLNVPGGSRTLLEISVPYHEQSLAEFLGRAPKQYCSEATAQAMALRALDRARHLAPRRAVAGVGCTAGLATDRPKAGDHRFYLCVHTGDGRGVTQSLTFCKGARDRAGEEAVLDAVLLNAMARTFGVAARVAVDLLPAEEIRSHDHAPSGLAALLAGTADAPAALRVEPDGRQVVGAVSLRGLFPGAFNPLHDGHRALVTLASQRLGGAVEFELSVANVDKGTLDIEEVRYRLARIGAPVWVTRAPTFAEKAALFPGATFVVGADTAERVLAPRYYAGGESGMVEALAAIRGRGCGFLVACRPLPGGGCLALENIAVPEAGHGLFVGIPRDEFCVDVSSTQLRGDRP